MFKLSNYAVRGISTGTGPGYTLEAATTRLADDIGELRSDGALPDHIHTRVDLLPQQRIIEIQVRGMSLASDPDRTRIRTVMNTLFELASFHNVVPLDSLAPPLFTQRIVLLDRCERPFAALVGAGVGDVEPLGADPTGIAGSGLLE